MFVGGILVYHATSVIVAKVIKIKSQTFIQAIRIGTGWTDQNTHAAEEKRREEWLKQHEGKPVIECKEVENYF